MCFQVKPGSTAYSPETVITEIKMNAVLCTNLHRKSTYCLGQWPLFEFTTAKLVLMIPVKAGASHN